MFTMVVAGAVLFLIAGLLIVRPHDRKPLTFATIGLTAALCTGIAVGQPTANWGTPTGPARLHAQSIDELPEAIRTMASTLPSAQQSRFHDAIRVIRSTTTDRATLPANVLPNANTKQLLDALNGRTAQDIIQTADTIRSGVPAF